LVTAPHLLDERLSIREPVAVAQDPILRIAEHLQVGTEQSPARRERSAYALVSAALTLGDSAVVSLAGDVEPVGAAVAHSARENLQHLASGNSRTRRPGGHSLMSPPFLSRRGRRLTFNSSCRRPFGPSRKRPVASTLETGREPSCFTKHE